MLVCRRELSIILKVFFKNRGGGAEAIVLVIFTMSGVTAKHSDFFPPFLQHMPSRPHMGVRKEEWILIS